jgi:hypothetical protein
MLKCVDTCPSKFEMMENENFLTCVSSCSVSKPFTLNNNMTCVNKCPADGNKYLQRKESICVETCDKNLGYHTSENVTNLECQRCPEGC